MKRFHEKFVHLVSHGVPARIRTYWKTAMASTHDKLSRGAEYISRIIPYARKENWRRQGPKK